MPPMSWHAGLLGPGAGYQRQYIDSAQRFSEAPRLSPAQVEALDLFDALLDDPRFHFQMRLEPGDLQFCYNHTLLHGRRAFQDWPEVDRRRHLFRLWLAPAEDRPLPGSFTARFGSVEVGNRGGILCEGAVPTAPLTVPQEKAE